MPIRLEDLAKTTKRVTFEYDGEPVTVEYRLNAVTPQQGELIERLTSMFGGAVTLSEENKVNEQLIDVLNWLVVSWDVLDDKGKPLPVTKTWLRKLPSAFLYTLFGEILADLRPNAQSAAISSDT